MWRLTRWALPRLPYGTLREQRFSQLQRYSIAFLTVLLALLLTLLLWQLHRLNSIYPLFLAAVMVSSWYGGLNPGLLATFLSAIVCAYFLLPPFYSLAVSGFGAVGLLQFVLVALLISLLNTALREARSQAQKNARAAQDNYECLRQIQDTLRQSEERYRLLIEGVTNYAIFMLDPNGNFTSWNIGAERILGYQEAEIIGQPFERIFSPEAIEREQPQQVLTKAVTEGFSKENRWHIRKDGTFFWAHCVITPLRDENGNLRGFSKIMQDITERKQAEEEKEQLLLREQAARAVSEAAQSAAEAANRSKDEFLAIVSHELRTPMTAIIGWAGMLQTGALDEAKVTLALEIIERNANLQMQLIEDLLDISRIVRGELSLSIDLVDLVEVITAAIEVVQSLADAKDIQIETILDTSIEKISGDLDRLQQVVLNLLTNAIKFTPNGGRIKVRLSKKVGSGEEFSQYPNPNYAQIQVSDTGQGISADFLPHVFERFCQADSTHTRSNKGLGLGLAIALHVVELHGGTIQAQSQGIGQGATFTVKLPVLEESRGESLSPSSPSAPLSPNSLTNLRVLVVDDEADVRQWITAVLEECGAKVSTFSSTRQALEGLEELHPDVLISDIGMPDEDGYALMRKIRELEPELGGRIPAVALTGYARVEDYKEALAAGFQLHVAKPVRAAELIAVVASLGKMSGKL
ncbi:PAS domain S-box protein [Nostoc sp. UCD121]|uniref:ATP-binding response regulator n=1 Tax=unclassified Nostoc TaxID=2593658 RepID=UPI00162AA86F|nr:MULTISPECIES: PAS domain S-box protein [unclassified Nostoc]MBC1225115.1 PAS domain S-box protein [Nostoc sp. UCD120]MBC1278210.1 PAS domain S-box protein [Nostoc sp. UCD121]MBC1296000.1 PAS domain S-box protein [Nostoc sp. UCD122]